MNDLSKQKVDKYFLHKRKNPLFFCDYGTLKHLRLPFNSHSDYTINRILPLYGGTNNLEGLINNLLNYAKIYGSCRESKEYGFILETTKYRYRSSGDIWRHCKSVIPELTIYEVMDKLKEMALNKRVSCSYCSTVRKKVFYTGYNGDYTLNFKDEYGLYLREW